MASAEKVADATVRVSPGAVAESLQAVLKQSSSAWQEVSEDATKKRKCRDEDLCDFYHRLSSFKTHWWFNKPLAFSALAAARRGWQNAGQDQLVCPVCGAELTIKLEGGHWMANGQRMEDAPVGASHEILEKGHSPFCPWRSVEVKNDPKWHSDNELARGVETRRAGLARLKHLPVVSEGEGGEGGEAADPADALASAGWEAVGTVDGRDFFRCFICLRTHIVQSFAHRETEAKEPVEIHGEGTAERQNKKPRTCQPTPSLWTPQIRVLSPSENVQSERATWFDPHAFHHYYCPLFCHPEEELGISAARMLKAKSTSDSPKASTVSAAEKAESLVRGLHVILPKEVDQD